MEREKTEYLKRLRVIFQRFSVNELETIIFERYIKDFKWEDFLSAAAEDEERVTIKAAANFLCSKLARWSPQAVADLAERTWITDVCLHSKRHQWTTFDLANGKGMEAVPRSGVFFKIVERKLMNRNIEAMVRALRSRNRFWLSVRLPKKCTKRQPTVFEKYHVPIFFSIPLDKPFMFIMTNKEKVEEAVLKAVASAVGYRSASIRQLRGKQISQLTKALELHENFDHLALNIEEPEFEVEELSKGGLDMTNHAAKSKYFDVLLTEDPPVLESLKFVSKEPFRLANTQDDGIDWSKIKFSCDVTIKSKNAWETVRKMAVEDDVWDFPPPKYLIKAFHSGKDVNDFEDSDDEDD
ncbi:uncharacterized protein LOC132195206 [Neocloeon triangulifer]|uniref:uncharacterized protein LOC132195206 n=1 Tax=Neocloeon triangulifer TaxID=2078957 RepID=UPI00286F8F84|nr:uncharacterized protein LOC132195206 [Neocloeon triangulifer]XP_059473024.1 uncharacterized protein LOC132195206 [Neocloeon triangulifer]XP_059473026.1 uncharacterized protein LOC132195206 [Neocloeon triangulifer]XP_059473027.1 uncharacterized protein LOC132195206 [Neocloeon triangulifer]